MADYLLPLSLVDEEFRQAGMVLFVDTNWGLYAYPTTGKDLAPFHKLLAGRFDEMKRFLTARAFRPEGEAK